MSLDKLITVRCPASLIENGNHMVNCFESCMPGMPILNVAEGEEYAQITVHCSQNTVNVVTAILAGQASLPEPAWNAQMEDESWLVDMTKANAALAQTVIYDPEGDIPVDKIVITL